jgi:hypothetical protein
MRRFSHIREYPAKGWDIPLSAAADMGVRTSGNFQFFWALLAKLGFVQNVVCSKAHPPESKGRFSSKRLAGPNELIVTFGRDV